MVKHRYWEGLEQLQNEIQVLEYLLWEDGEYGGDSAPDYTVKDLINDVDCQTVEALLDDPRFIKCDGNTCYVDKERALEVFTDLYQEKERAELAQTDPEFDTARERFLRTYDQVNPRIDYEQIRSEASEKDILQMARRNLPAGGSPVLPDSSFVEAVKGLKPNGSAAGLIALGIGAGTAVLGAYDIAMVSSLTGSATLLGSMGIEAYKTHKQLEQAEAEEPSWIEIEALEKRYDEEYSRQAVERIAAEYGDLRLMLGDDAIPVDAEDGIRVGDMLDELENEVEA